MKFLAFVLLVLVSPRVFQEAATTPAPSRAESGAVTITSSYGVPSGKHREYMKFVELFDTPVLEALRAEGAVLAWGIREDRFHEEGRHGIHTLWITLRSWDDYDDVIDAMIDYQEEVQQARPELRGAFLAIVDMQLHAHAAAYDHLLYGFSSRGA